MTDTKAVFEAAANAAREVRIGVMKRREKVAKQLAQIDEELGKLDAVISFGGKPVQPEPPLPGEKPPRQKKLALGVWPSRIEQTLAIQGLTVSDLQVHLQTAHAFRHPPRYLQKLLAGMEKKGRVYCDEERKWRVKIPGNGSQPRPTWADASQPRKLSL